MVIVGWVRAGIEVVDDLHAGQGKGVGRMSEDAGALSWCEVKTLMTPNHTAIQVSSSG